MKAKTKTAWCDAHVRNPTTMRMRRCMHPAKYLIATPYQKKIVCGIHARAWLPKARVPLELLK